ncbi:MAG: metallophosphoesterase family protein [Candidatus Cyclobacteriaceae bacterium M2_1C_046]
MKKIAYITDLHLKDELPHSHGVNTRENLEHILRDVKDQQIKEIIIGGDLGQTEEYPWLFDQLKDYDIHITLGNHDQYKDVKKYYSRNSNAENELYYSFIEEGFQFIILDSSNDKLNDKQVKFLKKKIDTAPEPLLIFIHHPIIEVDTYVDRKYPLHNRDKVFDILSNSKRDVFIFCGHYHTEDHAEKKNIKQHVIPAASLPIKKKLEGFEPDTSFYSYSILQLQDGEINFYIKNFQL